MFDLTEKYFKDNYNKEIERVTFEKGVLSLLFKDKWELRLWIDMGSLFHLWSSYSGADETQYRNGEHQKIEYVDKSHIR